EAVGLDADRLDVGAKLVENVRRDVVRGAMGAVEDDLHALEIELVREGGLAEFDIAPAAVLAPPYLAQARGLVAAHRPPHLRLERRLDLVGELEAVAGEQRA